MVQICEQWMKTDKWYPKISTVNERSNYIWHLKGGGGGEGGEETTFVIRAWKPDKKIKCTTEVRLKNYSN